MTSKVDAFDAFIGKIKASNRLTQQSFIAGVDNDLVKDGKNILKDVKPVRYDSFEKVHSECLPGDYLACIVKHKTKGTEIL